jgi:Uma2 family endonuclease
MNIQLPVHLDKTAFLAWVQGREGRYELAEGQVVMMTGASREHGQIVRNLMLILHGQIDSRRWEVIAEFGLDLGPKTLRYPDIVIDRVGGPRGQYAAREPVLVAEVLSQSTADVDLGDKPVEYLQLESVASYVVFSQNEPKAWAWTKGQDRVPATPAIVRGIDNLMRVAALDLTIPLAAVYAGVQLD